MCGIIGYSGKREAAEVLLEGLRNLEYRGYDSAGIALFTQTGLKTYKAQGRLSQLEALLGDRLPDGQCGIGHTRWATHGAPSDVNAHPHASGKVTLVHNGSLENYMDRKEILLNKGRIFTSQTDTEVIAQWLDEEYGKTPDPMAAICRTLKVLRGSYALGILFADHPGALYAVRKDSPLIVTFPHTFFRIFIAFALGKYRIRTFIIPDIHKKTAFQIKSSRGTKEHHNGRYCSQRSDRYQFLPNIFDSFFFISAFF